MAKLTYMAALKVKAEVAEKLERIYQLDLKQIAQDGVSQPETVQRIVRVFALREVRSCIQKKPGVNLEEIVTLTGVFERIAKEILLLLAHREEIRLEKHENGFRAYSNDQNQHSD